MMRGAEEARARGVADGDKARREAEERARALDAEIAARAKKMAEEDARVAARLEELEALERTTRREREDATKALDAARREHDAFRRVLSHTGPHTTAFAW